MKKMNLFTVSPRKNRVSQPIDINRLSSNIPGDQLEARVCRWLKDEKELHPEGLSVGQTLEITTLIDEARQLECIDLKVWGELQATVSAWSRDGGACYYTSSPVIHASRDIYSGVYSKAYKPVSFWKTLGRNIDILGSSGDISADDAETIRKALADAQQEIENSVYAEGNRFDLIVENTRCIGYTLKKYKAEDLK